MSRAREGSPRPGSKPDSQYVAGLHELAGVLTSKRSHQIGPHAAGRPPLDVALGAVGEAIGVRFPSAAGLEPTRAGLVKTLADAANVRAHPVVLAPGWFKTTAYPFIGYRGAPVEPVAVIPVTARRWVWIDPDNGSAKPVDADFLASLDPVAMVFVRPLSPGPLTPRALAAFLGSVLRRPLLSVLFIGVFSALMSVVLPVSSKLVFGQVIPSGQKSLLWAVVGLLAGAGAATILLAYAQKMAELRVSGIMLSSLASAIWDRLLRLPASFFRAYGVGDLQSRMEGIEALRTGLLASLRAVLALLAGLVAVVMMFVYSPALALIALVGLVVAWAIVIPLLVMRVRLTTALMAAHGQVASVEFELFSAVAKLRVAAAEGRAFDAWAQATARQLRIGWKLVRLSIIGIAAATVMPALVAAVIYACAGSALVDTLSVGDFMGFTTAAGMVTASFGVIRKALDEGLRVVPQYRRLKPIVTAVPEDGADATAIVLAGRVALDHVGFRYEADGPLVLDGVTITAEPGEFIAITGTSGAGKSTIIRLLLGFETPEAGSVLYDDCDLTQLSKSDVRRQLGTVVQRARVAAGTIAHEILGDTGLPIERAWAAAEGAGIAQDIRALPMGMATVIGEGSPVFSGGQIQRIAIARAIVAEPKVLLLDEATSALDNTVQASVGRALAGLSATRIVVAHRLSTIRDADRIYVLDHGRVVQAGSFDELMAAPGEFRNLVERQLLTPVSQ